MRARAAGALLFALPALAAAILAGCGGGSDETTSTAATSGGSDQGATAQEKPQPGKSNSGQGGSAKKEKKKSEAPASSGQPPSDRGSSAATPGVPTAKGGDNSIQEFGAESAGGERAQAAATAEAYFEARAAGRWAAACADLAAPIRKQIGAFAGRAQGSGSAACPTAMRALTEGAPPAALRAAARIEVLSLRREGSRAFLIYRDGEDVPSQVPMAREGGEWKVAAIAGSPLIL